MNELKLKVAIMNDIRSGVKWGKIASKYGVPMSYVQSVYAKSKNSTSSEKKVGGNGKRWKGWRIQDGTESPVITYNINELNK